MTHPDHTRASAPTARRGARLATAVAALSVLIAAALPGGTAQAADRKQPTPPASYTPVTSVMFNNPLGSVAEQRVLVNHIIATINSAPRNSLIRMAVFSFADPAVADALVKAYQRGVRVRLIFSDNRVYPPMKRLQQVMGANPNARSYAFWCDQSCRGSKGQMHAKYFSFNKAGTARYVTMVGSVNVTRYNAEKQWNDLYTVSDDKDYYKAYNRWFAQLKKDTPQAQPFSSRVAGLNQVEMTPLDLSTTPDPILDALSRVRCLVPQVEIDPTWTDPTTMVPTRILLSAHAWNGERGKAIAFKVGELARSGCQVKVLYGVGTGPAVTSILAGSGAEVSPGNHKGIRTHQKMMVIAGGYDGLASTYRAWTGSHNWSDRALARDDLIVQISNPQIAEQYAYQFDLMWSRA